MYSSWHPDNRTTWDHFFIQRQQKALARYNHKVTAATTFWRSKDVHVTKRDIVGEHRDPERSEERRVGKEC